MTNVDTLIDQYEDQARAADESGRPTEALHAQITANILVKWRDCLIRVASDNYSMSSNMARDLLREAGYCAHARTTYHAAIDNDEITRSAAHHCQDCGRIDADELVPYR